MKASQRQPVRFKKLLDPQYNKSRMAKIYNMGTMLNKGVMNEIDPEMVQDKIRFQLRTAKN